MSTDPKRSQLLEACQRLVEHANLLRDYALNPGNTWLAKSELSKINELSAELDKLLQEIKKQDTA